MRKLNKLLFLAFLWMPVISFCQQFSHTARLDSVPATGFYIIPAQPELTKHLDISLKDLRIVDEKEAPVPYILKSNLPELKENNFHSLPILENTVKDSGQTHLVFENRTKAGIAEIALVIRNAAVSRTARLSGSDDGKNWYAIAEDFELRGGYNSDRDRFVLNILFPPSSYRFFRLIVYNLKNDPLNILEAKYTAEIPWKRLDYVSRNPAPVFFETDSTDGYSYIRVVQPAGYHVHQVNFVVEAPRYFKRKMEIIAGGMQAEFVISSASSGFSVPPFNNKEFLVRIHNGENPPLKITGITTGQESRHIIAYLEKEKHYRLLMGNREVSSPAYDLENFRDSIPANISLLGFQPIQANIQSIVEEGDQSNITLWLIIICVLGVLSFFTWNLTRELKKRNQ